jgi:hypothetical protein
METTMTARAASQTGTGFALGKVVADVRGAA